ncbi:DUF4440 domain-containing protein [Arenimonas composti]|uniref:Uncharacterized protein n=1 Tax=Arenimonas composti TR7-09 = DSM 18010 TaxID=1121013 RepID=A0A091BIB0_9GAMM|nr:DUF4440 domain-containing protein [Arenimonas composti]KFN51486.1 hypothetical protein P873_00065 [Arenimonas composti TR7-09 = DSM 18010]
MTLLLALAAGCSRPPPEEALRETIAAMQEAAEARDAAALAEFVAVDFVGPGDMDRDGLRRYAAVLWLRHREVGVTLGPLDVEMREPHATVAFSAVVTGGQGVIPERAQAWQVHTAWRREGDDWRLISADWK